MSDDFAFMGNALALARRGMGETWPNPTVGCVFVDKGRGGRARPHGARRTAPWRGAAIAAAREAGRDLAGTTAYVSLEPCSHHGRTPPCADALVEARIARVVVATGDPDPRVGGNGLKRLRARASRSSRRAARRGGRDQRRLLPARPRRPSAGDPELATSLDGRIATVSGQSKWITGADARAAGPAPACRARRHHDRHRHRGGDDPELTCRLPGLGERSPVRIVIDSRARLDRGSKLVTGANQVPVWLVCVEAADTSALAAAGVEVIQVPASPTGTVDIAAALAALGARGLTRVLVEGGGRLAASLVAADLVDRLAIFRAGLVIGGDGLAAVAGYGLEKLDLARRYMRQSLQEIGADALETWARAQ